MLHRSEYKLADVTEYFGEASRESGSKSSAELQRKVDELRQERDATGDELRAAKTAVEPQARHTV